MVMWIVFGASAFISIYGSGGGTNFLQDFLQSIDIAPLALVAVMQVITLILGMFLDPVGLILLLLPIFYPIVIGLEVDQIWFCILFQLCLCIGYITPPFGYNLFYLKSMSPQTPIYEIYVSVFPYFLLMLLTGTLIFLFPELITRFTDMPTRH
jgi:TRAP-type mannitol/chloroaromatic compound transport system permease large subunit